MHSFFTVSLLLSIDMQCVLFRTTGSRSSPFELLTVLSLQMSLSFPVAVVHVAEISAALVLEPESVPETVLVNGGHCLASDNCMNNDPPLCNYSMLHDYQSLRSANYSAH